MLNKKIIYMALAIIIMGLISWSCTKVTRDNPLDPGASNYVKPVETKTNYTIIASDNFDYAFGTLPPFGDWLFSGAQPFCHIGNANGITGNAVRFYGGAAGAGENSAIVQNKALSGHIIVEFYMQNPTAMSGEYRSSFRLLDGSGVIVYLEAGANQSSVFFYDAIASGGGSAASTFPYNMSIWYYLKIDVDLTPGIKKFSLWYKDKNAPGNPTALALNQSIPLIPDTIPRFEFRIFNYMVGPTQETHIDNFKITKIEIVK